MRGKRGSDSFEHKAPKGLNKPDTQLWLLIIFGLIYCKNAQHTFRTLSVFWFKMLYKIHSTYTLAAAGRGKRLSRLHTVLATECLTHTVHTHCTLEGDSSHAKKAFEKHEEKTGKGWQR